MRQTKIRAQARLSHKTLGMELTHIVLGATNELVSTRKSRVGFSSFVSNERILIREKINPVIRLCSDRFCLDGSSSPLSVSPYTSNRFAHFCITTKIMKFLAHIILLRFSHPSLYLI